MSQLAFDIFDEKVCYSLGLNNCTRLELDIIFPELNRYIGKYTIDLRLCKYILPWIRS